MGVMGDMVRQRAERLGEMLKEVVSELLQKEVQDPRIGFVTVTGVEVSGDLRHAKIFVSIYGEEADKEKTLEGLNKARGFIRRELGQRIRLRHVPEILFRYDSSVIRGITISQLLRKVQDEDADHKH